MRYALLLTELVLQINFIILSFLSFEDAEKASSGEISRCLYCSKQKAKLHISFRGVDEPNPCSTSCGLLDFFGEPSTRRRSRLADGRQQ